MPRPSYFAPVTLSTERLKLVPLTEAHAPDLARHGSLELLKFHVGNLPDEDGEAGFLDYIRRTLADRNVPFAMVLPESGEAIGVSTYMDISEAHRYLEVGATWISAAHQGTFVNPTAKFLMLEYAFETLEVNRVQLKTDARNFQSQRAIEKLGAQKEGVLRNHRIMPDGFLRDTVMYSILPSEWPAIRDRLRARMEA
ncbi:MAG: GNAT family N-acetyltransferase [Fimbriimonas sp.]